MASRTVTAPSMVDAQRAAEALAEAGVGRVVLFGSVARGDANERSDIDLVAIYDDVDYRSRGEIASTLTSRAMATAGCRVDVIVTDRPEWQVRTTRVHTSLEARASRHGIVLVDRPEGAVDWGKEMVMPADDYQEGLYRLGHVPRALGALGRALKPGSLEAINLGMGNTELATIECLERLLGAGGAAHAAVEASIRALIHLTANPRKEPWGHRIEILCEELPAATRSVIEQLLDPVSAEALTPWHLWERYHRRGKDPDPTGEMIEGLARAACRVASYSADQFGSELAAERVRSHVASLQQYLDSHDITTGRRRTG